jgi:hypothetical protein
MWSLLGLIHFHPRYGEDHVGSIIDHHAPIGVIRDGADCFCEDAGDGNGFFGWCLFHGKARLDAKKLRTFLGVK